MLIAKVGAKLLRTTLKTFADNVLDKSSEEMTIEILISRGGWGQLEQILGRYVARQNQKVNP